MSNPTATGAQVEQTIAAFCNALAANSTLCVAYSGGVDSAVLLHALARHRPNIVLRAHHVHHGLSPNADRWAVHCQSTCDALGIALTVTRVAIDRNAPQGIEAAARVARYAALTRDAAHDNALIVTAHHARDQAETVLLQLLRGSGPAGLAAMALRSEKLLRPLLFVSKPHLDAYAAAHSIQAIHDESNDDPHFSRNRLRLDVWPALQTAFPSAESSLARAALLQAEANELAEAMALHDETVCGVADRTLLALAPWRDLSSARRRNLLRFWLANNSSPALAFDRLIEWEKQLLSHADSQNIVLRPARAPATVRVYRGVMHWVPDVLSEPSAASLQPIQWRGENRVAFGSGELNFQSQSNDAAGDEGNRATQRIRAPKPSERWLIRTRNDGDRIALSPKSGRVSFKNVMQHAGVSPWLREHWPVLTCNGVLAAIAGVCVAHDFIETDGQYGLLPLWKPQ
ncbi:MAG: tRNA lysidine(34) synthetase TilS [Betaproteobacteria bacterium]|nr:MAG: tRNA lysidine(34) synthetase TilS [Betaproteobacteria bacterium]